MSSRKRTSEESAATAAVVITPHKKKQRLELEEEDEDDNRITAESIMGFPKYPNLTNREIGINHHDFVDWAKRKKKEGTAFGRLLDFVNWVEESEEEVSKLEEERELIQEGQEIFNFGRHKGKTFQQIAQDEPNYHEKYMYMLAKNREEPNPVLSRYIAWFEKKNRHASATVQCSSETRIISQADDSGEDIFTFGKHKGQSFSWVASNDPSYHLRCKAKGYCPDKDCMNNYEEYFEHHGDRFAAEKGERDAILDRCYELGIGCHDCCYSDDDNYYSD